MLAEMKCMSIFSFLMFFITHITTIFHTSIFNSRMFAQAIQASLPEESDSSTKPTLRRLSSSINMRLSQMMERRNTILLICILVIFLLTQFPQGVLTIVTGIKGQRFRKRVYNNLAEVTDLLSLINACCTFVIYCCMNQQFRSQFKMMCCRKSRTDSRIPLCHV